MADNIKKVSKPNVTVFIAIAIVVVAIAGFSGFGGFKITGFVPSMGTATINLTSTVDITLTDANITFGAGAVTAGTAFAYIQSTGQASVNGSWATLNDPLLLENTGNIIANVSAYLANSWLSAIGGTSSTGFINWSNNETTPGNACILAGTTVGTWFTQGLTGNATNLCNKLNFSDSNDVMRIDVRLQISSDAPPGDKTNQMTFSATGVL